MPGCDAAVVRIRANLPGSMAQHPTRAAAAAPAVRDLYIDLLMKTLTMWLWEGADGSVQPAGIPTLYTRTRAWARKWKPRKRGAEPFDSKEARRVGLDWPKLAHTMIGMERMANLRHCVEEVLAKGVPGDLIETGVWRGGATIFMRGILKAHGVQDRRVWVADSFEGLPPPDLAKYPADTGDEHHTYNSLLGVSLEQVKSNFERYGLLDEQVCFLKGWFKDTLPEAPIEKLAVLRLDGDMYESTMDGLTHLYPKLSVGGFLIVDDYGIASPGCRQAVEDYRQAHQIREPLQRIDWGGVFWQRSA